MLGLVRYEPIVKAPGAQGRDAEPSRLRGDVRLVLVGDARRGLVSTACPAAVSTSPTSASTATRGQRRRDHLAIRWLGRHGEVADLTFGDLAVRTSDFAEVLDELGVAPRESGVRCSVACPSCTSPCWAR